MKRSFLWMAGGALMALIAGHAPAGTTTAPAVPKDEGASIKADQAAPATSGSSVVERDRKRYENQKRAADRRAAEMKKAERAKKSAGSSVAERDRKRYENQKRAAEQRAAEMKKAEKNAPVNVDKPQGPAAGQEQAPAMK